MKNEILHLPGPKINKAICGVKLTNENYTIDISFSTCKKCNPKTKHNKTTQS